MTIPPFRSGRAVPRSARGLARPHAARPARCAGSAAEPAPQRARRLPAGTARPPRPAQLAPGPALPAPPDVDGVEAVPLGPVLDQPESLPTGQLAQPAVELPGPFQHDLEGEPAAG